MHKIFKKQLKREQDQIITERLTERFVFARHFRSRGSAILCVAFVALAVATMLAACQNSDETSPVAATALLPPPVIVESGPESVAAYPVPATPNPDDGSPYPAKPTTAAPPSQTPAGPAITPNAIYDNHTYLPSIRVPKEPTPAPTSTPKPSPTPTIDFAAVRAQLQAQGQDLGFAKIGFHTGVGGNRNGLGDWMRRLDEAGVPFFLKTADDSGPLVEAQEIMRNSDVPHVLVYRRSGDEYDTPDYDLPPVEAAQRHWQLHQEAFPPELDPNLVWVETINEVDKERSEWLGQFALETARLALSDGFRWAAFGWSSGEPEISDWQSPSIIAFLRLAAENPDRLAVALHEYSYISEDISDAYPFKVGRFQQLFQVVDQLGIPRPTVLITEWGWEYQVVPTGNEAIEDIDWAAEMYAPYPEIKGAAIWYLGNGFGGIATDAQKLIEPVTEFSLGNYYPIPLPPESAQINPEQYRP